MVSKEFIFKKVFIDNHALGIHLYNPIFIDGNQTCFVTIVNLKEDQDELSSLMLNYYKEINTNKGVLKVEVLSPQGKCDNIVCEIDVANIAEYECI